VIFYNEALNTLTLPNSNLSSQRIAFLPDNRLNEFKYREVRSVGLPRVMLQDQETQDREIAVKNKLVA
jgi:hypothetical protein